MSTQTYSLYSLKMTDALSTAFFGTPTPHGPSRRAVRRRAVQPSKSSSFLDASSVAEFLGVSRRWVMEHTRSGDLPALKFGKVFRYKMSAIEAWLEGQNAKR
jgi:excisionase family DNA binding protein